MADSVLSVALIGADSLKKSLENTKTYATDELAKALNKAANDARQMAVAKAPHQTGRLWGSIHVENATASDMRSRVGTKLAYARAQEYGTVGMTIHSRSKKGTAFTYTGNIKAKFYMKQARTDVIPKLTNYLQLATDRIVNRIVTGR